MKKTIINLYLKYNEIINYVIVGFLTTIVSIGSYWLLRLIFIDYMICVVLSWIFAIIFAYFTNRIFVFKSKKKNMFLEFNKFLGSRLFTLFSEIIIMFILVDLIKINDFIAKILVQFVIVILNYVCSKWYVFNR